MRAWAPGLCRRRLLPSSRAHPPHLRLAPGPVVPPRGDARRPGGVRRPPARGGRVRAGRPGGRRRRRLRPRAAAGRRRAARRRDARPAGRLARPGRAHQRQPRLGPAARLQLAADRRRRRPPAHHAPRVGTPVAARRRPRAGRGLRPPLPRPAGARASRWALPRRSHEAALAAAMGRVRGDLAARSPGTRSVVLAHAFVAGRRSPASPSATSASAASRACRPALFDGVDYVALGHLHGAPDADRPACATAARPLAYSFSEADHTKGSWLVDLGARRRSTGRRSSRRRCRGRWPALRGDLDDAARRPRPCARAEDRWVQATLTDAVRPGPADGAAAAPVPARAGARLRARRRAGARRRPAAPGRARGPTTRSPSTSSARCAARRPPTDESALLQQACDACADDPDADTLLAVGAGG